MDVEYWMLDVQMKTGGKIILIASLLIAVFAAQDVFAFHAEQYPDNIEDRFIVTPTKFDFSLQPGQSIKQTFTIINRLGKPAEFLVQKEGLVKDGSGNVITTSIDWIHPELDKFTLNHGERVIMDIEVNVPEDVPAGGYYASVLIANKGKDREAGSGVEVISRVGIPLMITVPGDVIERGLVKEFRPSKFFHMTGPVLFFTEFENLGNIHLSPEGEIKVRNLIGSVVAQIPLESWTVLPNNSRIWQAQWSRTWLLGKYDAELTVFYGSDNQKVTKHVSFYAFPWHVFLLILAIFTIIYFVINKVTDKYEVRKKEKFDKGILEKVEEEDNKQ